VNAVAEITRSKNEIVALVEASPSLVLVDKQKFSQFYEAMKEECDAHTPDLTTERGRKAIASLAYKVARTKTAIDDAGKAMNEEARARINAVDESRREIRQQLDALKDEVRKPLTEWEAAEEARVDRCQQTITLLRESAVVGFEETAEEVRKRLDHIGGLTFSEEEHGGYLPQLETLLEQTTATLESAIARLAREEDERAELERLRAEAAERERQDRERREAEESERLRLEQARAAEEARERAEEQERQRIAAAEKAAEDRARQEAERVHAEALAAERRRADEAERAAQAERERIAREDAERKAAADREAAEQARRDADRAHRGKIMGVAKEAIMEAGEVDEAAAKRIVLAVAAGSIPNISIRF
jgi:colicin import membrane protein